VVDNNVVLLIEVENYVKVVQVMYRDARTQVRTEAGITDQFSVAVGMHQVSALSPYLFLLVMDALASEGESTEVHAFLGRHCAGLRK
jgi:hypothetical protein